MKSRLPRTAAFTLALMLPLAAHAEWYGHLELSTDRIERGVSQSDHSFGRSAVVGWAHPAGGYLQLGAASVSDHQYVGSDGYKLLPEIGWNFTPAPDWRAGVQLRGQIFPGAHGSWYGELPPRVSSRLLEAEPDNYGTAEFGLSAGWKHYTLAWSRSLTDYLGARAIESEGSGGTRRENLLESTGTQYLSLEATWPLTPKLNLNAGAGRLHVPNFDSLNYTDWRLGLGYTVGTWLWGVQASGTSASANAYRAQGAEDGRSSAENRFTASLRRSF